MHKMLLNFGVIFWFFALFLMVNGNQNVSKIEVSQVQSEVDSFANARLSSSNLSTGNSLAKSPIGKSIKEDSNYSNKKGDRNDSKNKESLRKENELLSIIQKHQINNFDGELRYKDQEEKKKGKLQTVGGVFGDIIGVIISEVIRIFGNIVSDVAREVTAHGFVSIFKQFTDLTGISLATNNLIQNH